MWKFSGVLQCAPVTAELLKHKRDELQTGLQQKTHESAKLSEKLNRVGQGFRQNKETQAQNNQEKDQLIQDLQMKETQLQFQKEHEDATKIHDKAQQFLQPVG